MSGEDPTRADVGPGLTLEGTAGLTLQRKAGESVIVGDGITVTQACGTSVWLKFCSPSSVAVDRAGVRAVKEAVRQART